MQRIAICFILTAWMAGCSPAPNTTKRQNSPNAPAIASTPVPPTPEATRPHRAPDKTPDRLPLATSELTEAQQSFRQQWLLADDGGKRQLTDLAQLGEVFWQATKPQVEAALGKPTWAGSDEFQSDVMRYELGEAPESLGDPNYHVTFEFQDGKVISVLGNSISRRP